MRSAVRLTLILTMAVLCSGCPLDLSWLPWYDPGTDDPQALEFTNADADGAGDPTRFEGAPGQAEDTAEGEGEGEGEGGGEEPRDVVEPDVIRRDGNLLYVLNQYRGLSIVDLDSETLLSQAPTLGYPRDLYLDGDRAFVLVGYAHNVTVEDDVVRTDIASRIYVLDVANPAAVSITASFDLEGDFVDSRMVGDVIYALSAEFQWYYYDEGPGRPEVDAVAKQQNSDSWVTSINVADPNAIAIADSLSFAGYGDVIQVTSTALFASTPNWETGNATITYIDTSDPAGAIAVRGSVTIDGQIADRFKMDAWNGVLRVVSATNWPDRNTYVTCVDLSNPDELSILGRTLIEGAAGETLFATRFDGARGYVVTYLQVDPLFVIDLSDPTNPTVAGELIVPGWSTHIEPQGDRLLALGVDDTDGRRVSVSIFDVADPAAPALLARESFGQDWAYSSAFNDVKAFTVLDDTLIVPFSGWDPATGLGFERLQFISYTADTLAPRGYVDLDGQILRSFDYGGQYYGVSTEQLAVIDGTDLDAPTITNSIVLAEYVADFQELESGGGAEIISRWDNGTTLVRTVDANGTKLGVAELAMANLSDTHAYGDRVVLVGTGWEDSRSFYQVVILDCRVPAAPVVETDLRVAVDPYYGGGCWDCYYGYPEEDVAFKNGANKIAAPWYPYWGVSNVSFVTDGYLSLRCYSDETDTVLGDAAGNREAIAVVDLEAGALHQVIGLGYSRIVSLDAADGMLYLGTREDAGTDDDGLPLAANFLAELDPVTGEIGPQVNVPGTFLQYDSATDVLVVEDLQYDTNSATGPWRDIWWGYSGVTRSLASVVWDGGATLSMGDTVDLPAAPHEVLGRGARVYFDYYDEGYFARSVTVASDGDLTLGPAMALGETYIHLIDAQGDTAYFNAGGRAIAAYDFAATTPGLAGVTEVMESPLRLRFGTETVYAPLGYAGLARIAE